jgi:hypothetical protein
MGFLSTSLKKGLYIFGNIRFIIKVPSIIDKPRIPQFDYGFAYIAYLSANEHEE